MATRVVGALQQYPARFAFVAYTLVIAIGTVLLKTPWATAQTAAPVSWVDALFTATSALCVTGLTVRSTGHDFSLIGQVIILSLIQLGGIGIVTVTTFVTLATGRGDTMHQRMAAAEALGSEPGRHLWGLVAKILVLIVSFELVGFVLLGTHALVLGREGEGWWPALFHAISAFCNAGFSLYDDSLERFRADLWYTGTIMALVVFGGLGFPVLADLGRAGLRVWRRQPGHLSLHTKLMLSGTAAVLVLSWVAFLLLEWENTLAADSAVVKISAALFQAVTCRTAGFNTIPTEQLHSASLWIATILMAIGAGPCSTAGGFKISTLMVLVLVAWRRLGGYERVVAFGRSISPETINRAIATALLFAVIGIVVLALMLVAEQTSAATGEEHAFFLDAFFETISALGTVGLSTGVTPELSTAAKLVLVVAMLLGRLGPITVFIALSHRPQRSLVEYPVEPVYIG